MATSSSQHPSWANATWKYLQDHRLTVCTVLIQAFFWSWLLTVDVASLSSSVLFGRGLSVVVWGVIVFLSSAILLKLVAWLRHIYQRDVSAWLFLTTLFFGWALAEWFVSWFVTLIWYGSQGSLDSTLPFGSFTPWLMYTPFGLLSRLVGYYGLSAWFVTLVVGVILPKTRSKMWWLGGVTAVATCVMWLPYQQATGQPISVEVASETLSERSQPQPGTTRLVVLPEYGLDDVTESTLHERVISQPGQERYFIGSQLQSNENGMQNVLLLGSTERGFISQQPKARLIPGGEYLPFGVEFFLRVTGSDDILQNFDFSRALVKGSQPTKPFIIYDGLVIGAEACASIIAPHDYRSLTKQGATLLTNSASLEIFRSPIFMAQHLGLAKFMAAANARPFVQAADSAPSFALDHNGRKLAEIHPVNRTEVTVQPSDKATPYTLFGDWPVYVGFMGVVVFMVRNKRSRKR